jgi:hypothetical protein
MPAESDPNRAQEPVFPRRSCFSVLGLNSSASLAEVTEAYRQLATTRHPDAGGNAEEFIALERAYRDCLIRVEQRPRFSGRPSGNRFRPGVPGELRPFRRGWSTLAVLVILPLIAWFHPTVALLAAAVVGPLLLGGLVAQLPRGSSLFVSGTLLVALGLGWLAAIYRIGWISYAFNTVRVSGRDLPAVEWGKQVGLVTALVATVLSVVMIVMGCVVAVVRERR